MLLRLTGKRGPAAVNTFDCIVIFMLSNVVQDAVISDDDSLLGGMVGAVTLVAVNLGVKRLSLINPTAERILECSCCCGYKPSRSMDRYCDAVLVQSTWPVRDLMVSYRALACRISRTSPASV